MFSNAEFIIRVVETPTSRTTVDRIARRPIERSGGYAVRYNGRYYRVRGGATSTPYIALNEAEGRV
jgi:hypothetical protein